MPNPIYGHSPHPAGTMFGYDATIQDYRIPSVNPNGEFAKAYIEKILVSGVYVYEAKAVTGSVESDLVWQAWRWDTTGPIKKLWADGNENFDNAADDLAGLSYS